jgi:hypothetical protein
MLTEYIQSLTTSSVNYDNRGKYIDAVYRFLDSAEEVSRRGWKRWKKAHAEELIYMPWGAGCRVQSAGITRHRLQAQA